MSTAYFKGKALTGPMGPQGPDGNPLGTIISYLGNEPPVGYLVCDGKEYQIADHSQLAAFFEKEFGSKNHFGGDGMSTFAVPDFRNLFLRGFHGESEEKLSGEIGAKQEGTEVPLPYGKSGYVCVPNQQAEAPDTTTVDSKTELQTLNHAACTSGASNRRAFLYTSRPVNAAVQYCIKATKSFEEDPPQGDISVGVFYNSKTAKVVVSASGWSANAPFTNTVAVADVIANADLQNIMVTPIEQHLNLQAKFGVIATSQGKASLTFTAVTKPDVDIIYYVFVVGSESVSQEDVVRWSPKLLSTNVPEPWVSTGTIRAGPAWRAFGNSISTSISVIKGDVSDTNFILFSKIKSGVLVPFTVFGLIFMTAANKKKPDSLSVYGLKTGNFSDKELIANIRLTNAWSLKNSYYEAMVWFTKPVKYGRYLFGDFSMDDLPLQEMYISDIAFLRSKADIIAEGGTV